MRLREWLRYARFFAFKRVQVPFSRWARQRRMQQLIHTLPVDPGTSVLDLGGSVGTWEDNRLPPLQITILNVPEGLHQGSSTTHQLRFLAGDGCHVRLPNRAFDCVYSNSVIEHVGNLRRRAQFAHEVRRLGRVYWVQTPSIWFPVEAHTGMPFWWFYPEALRRVLLTRWREKLPAWTRMVEGTTVLTKYEMRRLFPDARIFVERLCGIPKSYIAVRIAP